jgi:hypothetical protein
MKPQTRRTVENVLGAVILVPLFVIIVVGCLSGGEIQYGLVIPLMGAAWLLGVYSKRARKRDREQGD